MVDILEKEMPGARAHLGEEGDAKGPPLVDNHPEALADVGVVKRFTAHEEVVSVGSAVSSGCQSVGGPL